MSNYAVMPLNDYVNTCEAIREKTETTELIKSGEMADKITDVFNAGKKSEYDRFWDEFQQNGERTSYMQGFRGAWWNDKTFYPKYDIIAVGNASIIFGSVTITNLRKRLAECGVTLDTSQATNLSEAFAYQPYNEEFPVIDTSSANSLTYLFTNAYKAKRIEKLILKADGSQVFANTSFSNNYVLEDIEIEGTIGTNIWFQSCSKLTVDSMNNIISCLKDYSETTTTHTLTLHADAKARLSESEIAVATQKGWTIA